MKLIPATQYCQGMAMAGLVIVTTDTGVKLAATVMVVL